MNTNFYWALIVWNAHCSLAICHRFYRHCQVGGLAISAAPIVHWIGLKCLGFGDMYCMCSFSHVHRWHLRTSWWPNSIFVVAGNYSIGFAKLGPPSCWPVPWRFCPSFGFDSLTPADALPDSFHNQLWSGHAATDGSELRNKKVAKQRTLSDSEEGKSSVRFERLFVRGDLDRR